METRPTYCFTPKPEGPVLCVLNVPTDKEEPHDVRLVLGYGKTREEALANAIKKWHH